jgi:hypothetical protein
MLLDIPAECFERLIDGVGASSRTHTVLMNSVVVYDRQTSMPRRIIKILCDKSELDMVLEAAKIFCPEALAEIESSVKISQDP